MPRLHGEALLFCLAWAGLAVYAGIEAGWWVGALISIGLLVLVSAASMQVLTQTQDEMMERHVRWGILIVTGLALLAGLSLFG
jgi:hypothetical protein